MNATELAHAFGYLTKMEVEFIKKLCQSLPDTPTVVNIGAGSGTSSLAMVESREDIMVCTIDISTGGPLGGLENERNAFRDSQFKDQPLRWPMQVLGDSRHIGRYWRQSFCSVDMVFVDGGHLFDEISGDIDAWLPNVLDGGVMAFHDYTREEWGDVAKVVDKRMKKYELIAQVDTMIAFVIRKDYPA